MTIHSFKSTGILGPLFQDT